MGQLLFADKDRPELKPVHYVPNLYDLINDNTNKELEFIRRIFNTWFANYPHIDQEDLRVRIKTSFNSSIYELFVHEVFYKLGYTLTPHPAIPGSSKKPDFLACKQGVEFYIEAKNAEDRSQAEMNHDNVIKQLYDFIESLHTENFLLYIKTFKVKTKRSPSIKKIMRHIESELATFNPDVVTQSVLSNNIPKIHYNDEDIEIVVSPIPVIPSARGNLKRSIGMFPIESFVGGSDKTIKTALERKAGRYGELDKPYLICINSAYKTGANEFSVMNALFGSLAVTWSENPSNSNERWEHSNDGFFRNQFGKQHTRVSAVLITDFHIGNVFPKHWLVKHPFATKHLDVRQFSLTSIEVINNTITEHIGKSLYELLS